MVWNLLDVQREIKKLHKAIKNLRSIAYVADLDALPQSVELDGKLYYVRSEGKFVYWSAQAAGWQELDHSDMVS